MNKKLIAIAVASSLGLAANAANAGEVAIGGHAHVSVDYLTYDKPEDSLASDSNIALSSNSSRINVKGSEDLGNGTQVGFFMEWRVTMDGSLSTMAARNRYAFVKGSNWGEVRLGKHDTPMKIVGRKVDLFYSTQLGENRNIVGQADYGAGWDLRTDNTIAYITPGERINAVIAYVTDHNIGNPNDFGNGTRYDNNDFDALSAAINFTFGGFYVGLAYEVHNISLDSTSLGAIEAPDGSGTVDRDSDSEQALRLVGSWTGSNIPLKVTAFFQQSDDQAFIDGLEQQKYGLGLAWGKKVVFKGAWYYASEYDSNDGKVDDTDASQISLGVDYKATKRTMFYVTGMFLENGDNQNYGITGGHDDRTGTVAFGGEVAGLSLGLRHTF